MTLTTTRRSVLSAAAWSLPVIALSTAAPAAAVSNAVAGIDYGLFVTTTYNGGQLGYTPAQDMTGNPTTVTAYFPESGIDNDLNWNDATSKPTSTSLYTNGEGSFTPVTNAPNGTNGSYAATDGFWFSAPTTAAGTGTGYIAGATTTLATGATFVTDVEFRIPAGANAAYSVANAKINGTVWNKALSGTLAAKTATAPYLGTATPAVSWSAAAPVITKNADGSYTFQGRITSKTTQPTTATATATGKYYSQVLFMPTPVTAPTAYGWDYFQQTSHVQSATFTYTGLPANSTAPTTLSSTLYETSRINH